MAKKITTREKTAILSSLATGVVPAIGLQHIQVGRKEEVGAVLGDLTRAEEEAAAIRFIIGPFGTGKTFFLNLIRNIALERKFVVLSADFTTDRRLHGSSGQARALYAELMRNLATRSRPEGGALSNLVERWVGDVSQSITEADGTVDDVTAKLTELCRPLQDHVAGYDFATVISAYYKGYLEQDEIRQTNAIRWLRAEYKTRSEAKKDLGVRSIIDDASIYDYLKLFAAFVRIAGYAGCVVSLDELVVVSHRLNSKAARNNNYEAILRILNDCLQGSVEGLVFLFAATDDCLEDKRRGLKSYEALAGRLAKNRFATDGRIDMSNPVLSLPNLTPEDCYVLLHRIRAVHADDDPTSVLPDEGVEAYLQDCGKRLGASTFQSPREVVKDFIGLLNVLTQNPGSDWRELLQQREPVTQKGESPTGEDEPRSGNEGDDDLDSFRI